MKRMTAAAGLVVFGSYTFTPCKHGWWTPGQEHQPLTHVGGLLRLSTVSISVNDSAKTSVSPPS
jgi:hypothetical protein